VAQRTKLHHYRSHLAGAFEPASANRKLAALNTFLQWAVTQKYIGSGVPKLKSVALAPKKWLPGLNSSEKKQLLQSVRDKGTQFETLILRLLLEHGLRVDEVCALKWKNVNIDPDSAGLHIPLPKPPSSTLQKALKRFGVVQSPEDQGRWSTREVSLNKETATIFREIESPGKQGSLDLVFLRNRGPMTRRAIELMVRRHSQLAGVEANVRTLAHTFSASSHLKSNFFDCVIDHASSDDPSQSSRETTIPLRQPGPRLLADSFSDLRFPAFLLLGDRDLFVSAYSTVPVDDHVRLAVIRRANGKCERCGFYFNNSAFLDVHHIIPTERVDISEGADRYNNCVALCPNCHREAHMKDRWGLIQAELRQIAEQFGPDPLQNRQKKPHTKGKTSSRWNQSADILGAPTTTRSQIPGRPTHRERS
jgi:integrase